MRDGACPRELAYSESHGKVFIPPALLNRPHRLGIPMTIIHPFDSLVRELNDKEKPEKDRQLRRVDRHGNVLTGRFGFLATDRRFAIRLDNHKKLGVSVIRLRDRESSAYVDLSIRWSAKITGDGNRLIEHISKSNEAPIKAIEHAMSEFLQTEADRRDTEDLTRWLVEKDSWLIGTLAYYLASMDLAVECVFEIKRVSAQLRHGDDKPGLPSLIAEFSETLGETQQAMFNRILLRMTAEDQDATETLRTAIELFDRTDELCERVLALVYTHLTNK